MKVKSYVAPFQYPESGEIDTWKDVRSLAFGNWIVATFPPSNSAMSVCAGDEGSGKKEMERRNDFPWEKETQEGEFSNYEMRRKDQREKRSNRPFSNEMNAPPYFDGTFLDSNFPR